MGGDIFHGSGPGSPPLASRVGVPRSLHCLEVAGDVVQRVPAPWSDDHPRAELLRKTGFQVRFQLPLPRDAEHPAFVPWCAERLKKLRPTHRWLVKHLYV